MGIADSVDTVFGSIKVFKGKRISDHLRYWAHQRSDLAMLLCGRMPRPLRARKGRAVMSFGGIF
jgi:hypothetical protein